MRLMKVYPEVPNWWYYVVFVITVAISLAVTQAWPTHLTWWAFFIAIFIAILWFLPIGMIQATTNIQIGLNVITEFIIGYMQPGRPVAMMTFKTFGYITMAQGMSFVQDLKLGHYMKIPPKTLFYTQTAATVWASLVEVAVMNWALGSIKGVCTKAASDNFTCPQAKVFYTASVVCKSRPSVYLVKLQQTNVFERGSFGTGKNILGRTNLRQSALVLLDWLVISNSILVHGS